MAAQSEIVIEVKYENFPDVKLDVDQGNGVEHQDVSVKVRVYGVHIFVFLKYAAYDDVSYLLRYL